MKKSKLIRNKIGKIVVYGWFQAVLQISWIKTTSKLFV